MWPKMGHVLHDTYAEVIVFPKNFWGIKSVIFGPLFSQHDFFLCFSMLGRTQLHRLVLLLGYGPFLCSYGIIIMLLQPIDVHLLLPSLHYIVVGP